MSDAVLEKRIWLAIPQTSKEAAMADAGRLPDGRRAIEYSSKDGLWFALPGADMEKLKKWLPDQTIRSSGGGDSELELRDALTAAGMVVREKLVLDGQSHRLTVVQGKKGNKDGVYKVSVINGKAKGWYINYQTSLNDKDITYWKASESPDKADPVARVHIRANARQQRDDAERAQAELYIRSTASAKMLYDQLPPADPAHPYLLKKGVTAISEMRQTRNGALVIPFEDVSGEFRTLQYIPPDGAKYLYKNAPKAGHFRTVGGELKNGEPILYAEGYATACSIYMVTGRPVVMTIDAGNMENVSKALKVRYPDSPHLYMADVDHSKKINKGVLSAKRAAAATGGIVLLPDLTAAEIEKGFTDFNDLHLSRGTAQLRGTLLPSLTQALEQLNYKDAPMATPDDAQPAPNNLTAVSTDDLTDTAPSRRPGAAKEKTGDILKLRDEGLTPAQIAKQLGIGQTSVYRILKAQQPEAAPDTAAPASSPEPAAADVPDAVADVLPAAPAATQQAPESDVSLPSGPAVTQPVPLPDGEIQLQVKDNVPSGADAEPAVVIIPPSSDTTPEPVPNSAVADAPQPVTVPESTEAARALALSLSGLSVARVAAELNTGMGETLRLIEAGRKQEPAVSAAGAEASTESVMANAPSEDSEKPEADLRAELDKRPADSTSPLAAAFGEENAILVGSPRLTPQDDDKPQETARDRVDLDKLISRITHEKHPDGKSVLFMLDGEPAFVDRANRLVMAEGASSHEEKVLAALLTASEHYHGKIELTGSDEFKAFAIGLIVANDLKVSMKNASQQLALTEARRAAGQPVSPAAPADAVHGDQQAPRADEAWAAAPVAQTPPADVPVQAASPVTPSSQQHAAPAPVAAVPKIPPAVHTPAEKAREPVTGKVTAFGQAPFRFEPGEGESTFITLRTKEGPQTFWGKELAGLLREANLKTGRMVTLQWQGKQPVTVKVPKKNAEGVVTHYENENTHRNRWSLSPAGGTRVQTGADDLVPLAAVDVNRYTQIQHTLVSRLGITIDAPPKPADGLYWLKPDGQGSSQPGDPLSAPRPAHNERAGVPVMSSWGEDGRPDMLLVQGDGDYLQGVVRQNGIYQHVLVSLPGSPEAPPMVVNLLTPEGAQPIGSGNGINRSNGQPVAREHVVVRLTGDAQPRIAKLDAPADVPAALHARLGYDERYKPESGWVKEQPAAAPQAVPATPPRPAQ